MTNRRPGEETPQPAQSLDEPLLRGPRNDLEAGRGRSGSSGSRNTSDAWRLPGCLGLNACSVVRGANSGSADQIINPTTSSLSTRGDPPVLQGQSDPRRKPKIKVGLEEQNETVAPALASSPPIPQVQLDRQDNGSAPSGVAVSPSTAQQHQLAQLVSGDSALDRQPSSGEDNNTECGNYLDIIQFSAPIFFVEENERKLAIDVMRMGSMLGRCKVKYYTEDASAKAGERYEAANGTLVFNNKEHTKSIIIKILEDDHWATTTEFKIHLKDGDNCEIGQYLHVARVKVIDNDFFPSSKYREEIEEGEEAIENINGVMLFREFVKLNLDTPGCHWRTILILILDQMKNLYVGFTLYINIYVVDVLFNDKAADELWIQTGPQEGRVHTALMIGVLYVVPFLFLHIWDLCRVRLDIAGRTREFLQLNLFRKYLNYTEGSRAKISPSAMQVALVQDTAEVAAGYEAGLNILCSSGKLLVMVYFILKENPNAITPVITMPTAMLTWVFLRSNSVINSAENKTEKTKELIDLVGEACNKYRLIADYQQRPQICELFEGRSGGLGKAQMALDFVQLNNRYFAKWLGPLFIGSFVAMQTIEVLQGNLKLGVFLATIRIFNELSENFGEAYEEVMELSSAIGPLRKLSLLFNLSTDLLLWKNVNRKRRELSKMARLEALHAAPARKPSPQDVTPTADNNDDMTPSENASAAGSVRGRKKSPKTGLREGQRRLSIDELGGFRTDQIEIKLTGVCFHYKYQNVLSNVTLAVPQGSLVAIVGNHGSGKSTLLRLLGHTIFPVDGTIFVPTHLRILHVGYNPTMLDLSAWHNLTFGRPHADPKRVKRILKALSMFKTWALVEEEFEKNGRIAELGGEHRGGNAQNGHKQGEDAEGSSNSSDLSEFDDEGFEAGRWQEQLSYAELAKIHFARALIVNPEVLVLHRPFAHYDEMTARSVMEVLQEHVRNRGFKVPSAGAARRRPRTCFFTPTNESQAKQAHVIWGIKIIKDNGIVRQWSAADLQENQVEYR